MRIITGDQTGLNKVINVEKQSVISTFGTQEKDNEQDFLKFLQSEQLILSANPQGQIQLNEIDEQGNFERLVTMQAYENPNKHKLISLNVTKNNRILLTFDNNSTESLKYDFQDENFSNFEQIYNQNQKCIQKAKLDPLNENRMLILAKDINPQLYDLETGKNIWKARNVKNDWLDLQVPIWDVDGSFFGEFNQSIYTVNAYKKIRIYDLRKNNSQPVTDHESSIQFDKTAFRQMVLSNCSNYMFVSTVKGNLFKFDVRKNFQMLFNFSGSSGSIKDIQLHPNLPYIGTVSLDRFLRVFDINSKENLYKVHLKQRLHSLLWTSQGLEDEENEENEDKQKQEQNELINDDFMQDDEEEEPEQDKEEKKFLKKQEKREIEKKKFYEQAIQHKKKFQNLKKHTIQLSYLKKKQQEQQQNEEDQDSEENIEIQQQQQKKKKQK